MNFLWGYYTHRVNVTILVTAIESGGSGSQHAPATSRIVVSSSESGLVGYEEVISNLINSVVVCESGLFGVSDSLGSSSVLVNSTESGTNGSNYTTSEVLSISTIDESGYTGSQTSLGNMTFVAFVSESGSNASQLAIALSLASSVASESGYKGHQYSLQLAPVSFSAISVGYLPNELSFAFSTIAGNAVESGKTATGIVSVAALSICLICESGASGWQYQIASGITSVHCVESGSYGSGISQGIAYVSGLAFSIGWDGLTVSFVELTREPIYFYSVLCSLLTMSAQIDSAVAFEVELEAT